MDQGEKITLRISRDNLDEIDEFLGRNPRYGSRSEFLRNLAIDFIAKTRVQMIQSDETVCVKLPSSIDGWINQAVNMGIFNSTSEAVGIILNDLDASGKLLEIIANRFKLEEQKREILKKYTEGTGIDGNHEQFTNMRKNGEV